MSALISLFMFQLRKIGLVGMGSVPELAPLYDRKLKTALSGDADGICWPAGTALSALKARNWWVSAVNECL
ncbi:hypothetical protein [Azonexus sp.]|uniref:hypothetical protein n=1 Tax=Azonexus sp. TaxID=1872668 RepID=UPI0035B3A4C4